METLVLDARYLPIGRVSWTRAVSWLWLGKVEVLDSYGDWTVRSVSMELQVPAVIRFLRAVLAGGRKRAGASFTRQNVYARDGGRCQYCQRVVSRADATYDHVVPRAQGGKTHWANIVIACAPCNRKKGGRTPEQAGMALRKVPVRPSEAQLWRVELSRERGESFPAVWRRWLRDYAYWNGTLDEDA